MTAQRILTGAMATFLLAFLTMAAVTFIWMTIPYKIVYRESSPQATPVYSVEETQHGRSFFITPRQKRQLDAIRKGTPLVWFTSLGIALIAYLVAAAARLRLPAAPNSMWR